MTDVENYQVEFRGRTNTVAIGDGHIINEYRNEYRSDYLIAIDSSSLDNYKIYNNPNDGLLTIHRKLDWTSWTILIIFFMANIISLVLSVLQATNAERAIILIGPLTGSIALMGVLVGYRVSKQPLPGRVIKMGSQAKDTEN